MRTIRKRLLALLLTVAMLGTLFAGLPIASAASEALGNVTDAAVDGNTLLLTIDSGGSASDLLTLEVCQDNTRSKAAAPSMRMARPTKRSMLPFLALLQTRRPL